MSKLLIAALAVAGLAGVLSSRAKADEWDQRIVFTFNEPVEIPGQALPAGTYVFKLADSASDRDIVQVFQHYPESLPRTRADLFRSRNLTQGAEN